MTTHSILVAYDFSEPARRALDWARTMHAQLHTGVVLLFVEDDRLALVEGQILPADWSKMTADRHAMLDARLRSTASEVFGPDDQIVRTRVVAGHGAECIARVAREMGCDLVIAGSTGKNAVERFLLGSTTLGLLRGSRIPVMVVH
jgi:nucleotide-binding universal stress UspA family protein